MPRQARKKSRTGIYHILIRGINRQTVFEDDEDCAKFINTMEQYKENDKFEFYGYCLMGNHIHLLMGEGKNSISLSIQKICSSFVYWYNWKYDRYGHLFQERFKSEVVENDEYLLAVLRHIHQNPVKSGITDSVENYKWSSYHEYIHKQNIIDTDFILAFFGKEVQKRKKEFIKYMKEESKDVCLDYEEKHRIADAELVRIIEEEYGIKKDFFYSSERNEMNTVLKRLKAINGVSIRQLVRVTGVSKYIIEKA